MLDLPLLKLLIACLTVICFLLPNQRPAKNKEDKTSTMKMIVHCIFSHNLHKVVEHPTGKGWVFIMEHVEMRPLSRFQAALGEQLAR